MNTKEIQPTEPAIISFVKGHPAITISLIAILITLSLYAYFLGVLDRFQLEPSLFPLSIERTYQLGIAFLVRTDWLVLLLALFIIVIFFSAISTLAFLGIVYLINKSQEKIVKRFPNIAKNFSPIIVPETSAFIIMTMLIIMISLTMFYQLGKYRSVNREIVDYSTTIKMKGENGALYENSALILCGSFCAIHIKDKLDKEGEKTTILLIPANDIQYIKQELSNGKD